MCPIGTRFAREASDPPPLARFTIRRHSNPGIARTRRGPEPASSARRPPGMNRRTALLAIDVTGRPVSRGASRPRDSGRKLAAVRDHVDKATDRRHPTTRRSGPRGRDSICSVSFPAQPGFKLYKKDISRIHEAFATTRNPREGPHRLDLPPHDSFRLAWRPRRRALRPIANRLYAYNSPEILKQVDEIVERFHQRHRGHALIQRPDRRRGRHRDGDTRSIRDSPMSAAARRDSKSGP